jgi:hypothetical protein
MSYTITLTADTEAEAQALLARINGADSPKAPVAPKSPKVTGKALTRSTRKAFIAALPAAQKALYAHKSALDLAMLVTSGTIKAPKGFRVGAGNTERAVAHLAAEVEAL